MIDVLRCPATGQRLVREGDALVTEDGKRRYAVTPSGIPLFGEQDVSPEALVQQKHYDRVAAEYIRNLSFPHTQEYNRYLDDAFLRSFDPDRADRVAEICCGRGEAFALVGERVREGVGVDISRAMLEAARRELPDAKYTFVQGDATRLPLASDSFDRVVMLGGIHHVADRRRLFAEIHRILKPGGTFHFREPVSDFWPWLFLRWIVYRVSPALDADTERPLRHEETVPVLASVGMEPLSWETHGFLGFCFFMNSDVLVFNRLFRFVPGIRPLTRAVARFDAWCLRLPGMARRGLQVVGSARKPERSG